jgi:hypothetical protein
VVLKEAVARACQETAPEQLREEVMLKLRGMQSHDA